MSDPVDMHGKQPHTLAARVVISDVYPQLARRSYERFRGVRQVFRCCAKYVKQPSWAAGTGDPP